MFFSAGCNRYHACCSRALSSSLDLLGHNSTTKPLHPMILFGPIHKGQGVYQAKSFESCTNDINTLRSKACMYAQWIAKLYLEHTLPASLSGWRGLGISSMTFSVGFFCVDRGGLFLTGGNLAGKWLLLRFSGFDSWSETIAGWEEGARKKARSTSKVKQCIEEPVPSFLRR